MKNKRITTRECPADNIGIYVTYSPTEESQSLLPQASCAASQVRSESEGSAVGKGSRPIIARLVVGLHDRTSHSPARRLHEE